MNIYINHFNPNLDFATRALVYCCASYYVKNTVGDKRVTVVDGSGVVDAELENLLLGIGCLYLPSAKKLSFAEGYNVAFAEAGTAEFVISASDIFVPSGWNVYINEYRSANFSGMLMPYLSDSDYPTQEIRIERLRRPIHPLQATINLNYFSAGVGVFLGGLSLDYTGSYNDLDMLIRLRRCGYSVMLVNLGPVKHLGRMTIINQSSWVSHKDRERFGIVYPEYVSGKWWARIYKRQFCNNRFMALIFKFAHCLMPHGVLKRFMTVEIFMGNKSR